VIEVLLKSAKQRIFFLQGAALEIRIISGWGGHKSELSLCLNPEPVSFKLLIRDLKTKAGRPKRPVIFCIGDVPGYLIDFLFAAAKVFQPCNVDFHSVTLD
jgi:hypothetical protein